MKKKKPTKKEAQQLFDEALESLKSGKSLEGKDGALTPLIKRLIEVSLKESLTPILMKVVPTGVTVREKRRENPVW